VIDHEEIIRRGLFTGPFRREVRGLGKPRSREKGRSVLRPAGFFNYISVIILALEASSRSVPSDIALAEAYKLNDKFL
jgi:hypothetical protein